MSHILAHPVARTAALAVTVALLVPGAVMSAGTLFVQGSSVGIGTETPNSTLHVKTSDGTGKFLVEETSTTVAGRTLFELKNKGNPRFFLKNSDTGVDWQMSAVSSASSASFTIDEIGDPAEFIVRRNGTIAVGDPANPILDVATNGNLTIKGVLFENSSVEVKDHVTPVDGLEVLGLVRTLPIHTWSYKVEGPAVRHMGPMAQDFHAAFGLGGTSSQLATLDTSGVALAAIQGLSEVVDQKAERIAELELENEALEARLAALEARLEALADQR